MLIRVPAHSDLDLEAWEARERADAVHAQLSTFRRKCARALADLLAFSEQGRCYVGTSWGKDSTVLAHLAADLARTHGVVLPLVWVRIEPVTNPHCVLVRDAFLERHRSFVDYDEVLLTCARDENGWLATGRLEAGFEVVRKCYGKRHISGVRGQESGERSKRMQAFGVATKNTCAPIGWWSADDVFAYLRVHDLPVHPAYAMTLDGALDRARIRVASIGGERGTGHGRREWEQRYYRDVLQRVQGDVW